MKVETGVSLAVMVGIGVAGYVLYQKLTKLPCTVNDAAWSLNDCVENQVTSAWDWLTGKSTTDSCTGQTQGSGNGG
jgi:hypothetical protein